MGKILIIYGIIIIQDSYIKAKVVVIIFMLFVINVFNLIGFSICHQRCDCILMIHLHGHKHSVLE